MDFKKYYSGLPRLEQQKIRNLLQEAFCVNESTIYRWINGEAYPGVNKARKIGNIIGVEEGKLFPNTKKKDDAGK